ncbi:MAG: helix-turn-helix domain-containing protein [Chloroflexi bacterium]|nr:helix-turn-helix domain-containing protein [Chloroflexota bacterium]
MKTLIIDGRRWFSLAEATQYVSLSDKTLMKYVRSGVIYGTRKGGKWLIDRTSLDTWLEEDKIKLLNLINRKRGVR